MSLTKKMGSLFLAALLLLSLLAGCGKTTDKGAAESKPQPEKSSAGEQPAAQQPPQEQTIPVSKIDLGMKPDDVVAEYEGGKLTAGTFQDYLEVQAFINPQAGAAIQDKNEQVLNMFVDSYVGETVMAARAPENKNVDKDAKALADRIKGQYKSLYGGDDKKVEKQMKDQGVTDDDLQNFFIRYKKVEGYLTSQVKDADLKQKYDQGKKDHEFTVASVRHILISITDKRKDADAKKLADDIAARLRKGEDFAKLAKQYSDDPGSKDKGGLYENTSVNQWVPQFKQAAIDLPLNKISDPIKTDYGYHVMRVESRKELSFDEVKTQLKSSVINDKYFKFTTEDVKPMIKKVNLPKSAQPSNKK